MRRVVRSIPYILWLYVLLRAVSALSILPRRVTRANFFRPVFSLSRLTADLINLYT
jgi:hypothetical protein